MCFDQRYADINWRAGERLTEAQIEEMIQAADIDGDRQIDYEGRWYVMLALVEASAT